MINPHSDTILDLLNQPYRYAIPRYQRGYEWRKDEVSELIEDLMGSKGPLFLGTMIFDQSQREEQGLVYVVDGQQRLTSIILLLIACRQAAKELGESNAATVTQQKIAFLDPTTAEMLGARLLVSESIRGVFEHICPQQWNGEFPEKLGKHKPVRRQVRRLKPAYDYLAKSLNIKSKEDLTRILKAVYDAHIIRIDVQEEEEAFGIFERTNARGLDLTVGDLLKNYLYKEKVKELDDRWSRITENSDHSLLRMLKYFHGARNGKASKSELYKKLKSYANGLGSTEELVDQLLEFSVFYSVVRRESEKKEVQKFFYQADVEWTSIASDDEKLTQIHFCLQALRLFGVTQPLPLIYSAILCAKRKEDLTSSKSANKFIRLLRILETYHFINSAVSAQPGNEVEKTYSKFCVEFQKATSFSATVEALAKELTGTLISENDFSEKFRQLSYSSSDLPLIAYIFDRICNAGNPVGSWIMIFNPDPTIIKKSFNVEHFAPQKADKKCKDVDEDSMNNIGNLLLVPKQVNSALGNLCPQDKFKKLSSELKDKVAIMPYVAKFVEEYEALGKSWDGSAIAKRASDMAKDAYTRVWKFPL